MVNLLAILAVILIGPFIVAAILLDNSYLPTFGLGLFIIAMPFVGRGSFPLHIGMGLFLIGLGAVLWVF